MQKRIPSAQCLPLVAASTFTVFGVAVLIAAGLTASTQPAAAQQGFGNFYTYQGARKKRVVRKRHAPAAEATTVAKGDAPKKEAKKEAEKSGPKQPVYIVVSLSDQHASIYDADGLVTRTRVSTGQAGHRTPTGVFSVIGKERWHRSNIYSGAPMPFMQRITWSGVAMHAGVVPGYPASHGCIRLPAGFAPQLFGMTRMGARVVVTPRDVQPVAFSHDLLPLPKMQPPPAMPAGSQQAAAPAGSVELASMGDTPLTTAAVPEAPRAGGHYPGTQPDRLRRGFEGTRRGRQAGCRPGDQGCARSRPGSRRRSPSGRRRRAHGRGGHRRRRSADRRHRRAHGRAGGAAGCSGARDDGRDKQRSR